MRCWHKDLLKVLPRQQLLSQWRECCCIARNIAVNGTPNHLLVNKILNYPIKHFWSYSMLIRDEMIKRGYSVNQAKLKKWVSAHDTSIIEYSKIFEGWHNDRYLLQCFCNLQEKYDCGGITQEEWQIVDNWFNSVKD